jgi:hypothetical protein
LQGLLLVVTVLAATAAVVVVVVTAVVLAVMDFVGPKLLTYSYLLIFLKNSTKSVFEKCLQRRYNHL